MAKKANQFARGLSRACEKDEEARKEWDVVEKDVDLGAGSAEKKRIRTSTGKKMGADRKNESVLQKINRGSPTRKNARMTRIFAYANRKKDG